MPRTKKNPEPASAPDPETKVNEASDDELVKILGQFKKAKEYVDNNYKNTWLDCWKIYNSKRVRRGYDGVSDTFVPETFTIVESIVANISSGDPKFSFLPTFEEQAADTKVLNSLVQYYWDCNQMSSKTVSWVRESIIYGNGICFIDWDADGNKPRIRNIPLTDFFVDPAATNIDNARYAGFRYLTTKDELKKQKMIDPKTGELVPKYSNLKELDEVGYKSDHEEMDKEEKEKFLGSTYGKDANTQQVEVIYFCTREKLYEVGNRSMFLSKGATPFGRKEKKVTREFILEGQPVKAEVTLPEIKPFLPFAPLRNYVDPSLFYAKGDVENLIDEQEQLNDISNQKLDNITYVLNNMWSLDPQFEDMKDEIESLPGAVYPIPKGALTPIDKPVVTQDADIEMLRIKDEMRRVSAADEIVQGASQDKGRITATEVQAQLNQAGQRFATKLRLLETEGFATMAKIMMRLIQIFVDQTIAVRIVGPEGVAWQDFDPYEYSGEYEPIVRLEATTKAIKAEEGQKLTQLFQLILNHPLVNQQEALRVLMEKAFEVKEEQMKRLLDVPPEQLMQQQMAMAGEATSDTPSAPLPTTPMGSY